MSESKLAVRYFTKTGNTEKLAKEIGKTLATKAETLDKPIQGKVDTLFLGCSVYAGGVASEVKDYIMDLKKEKVGKVVVFSTSALAERGFPQVSKLLKKEGIEVVEDNFYCRGEFKFLHKGRPNQEDLKAAKTFAQGFLED